MAITIEEAIDSRAYSRNKDGQTLDMKYNVFGTTDPFAAEEKLIVDKQAGIGQRLILDGNARDLFVVSVNIDPEPGATSNGEEFLRATVPYGNPESEKDTPTRPTPNVATWKLSTVAQAVHIETILPGTTQEFLDADAKFHGDAIGYSAEGIQGVDVLRPHALLTIEHWLPFTTANAKFLDGVMAIGGSVNKKKFSGPWGDWLPGEALYHGAEVTTLNPQLISLVHTFERSLQINKIKIKGIVGEFDKKEGWDYFWTVVDNKSDPNDAKKILRGKVISAHIARVYERKTFAALALPKDFLGGQ